MSLPFARSLPAILFALLAWREAYAETATLSPVADTTLFEHEPDNNLGATTTLIVGTTGSGLLTPTRNRALLKFDVAGGIPTNATITSATLTIEVTKNPNPKVDSIIDLRRMLRSWTEGKQAAQIGSAAGTGESTWRARSESFVAANAILWAVPGGGTNSDFSATVSASTMMRGVGTYTFASTPELVADVQAWLQDTNLNQGWIIMSELEKTSRTARRIASREATAANRPHLVVEFAVPATSTPPRLQSAARSGDTFHFAFAAEANLGYAAEFTDTLPAANWQTLTNIDAQAAARQVTVSDGSVTNTPGRFYRVRVR